SDLRDIEFEPERGNILDINGEILAENVTAPSVIVVPAQVENQQETADVLADILDIPAEKSYEYVTQSSSSVRIHPEGRKITEAQEKAIQTANLSGVFLAKDSKRHYPHGDYLSHVLGFAGIDNQGLMGLELYYDEKLSGEKGSLSYYSDAKGKRMEKLADQYVAPVD